MVESIVYMHYCFFVNDDNKKVEYWRAAVQKSDVRGVSVYFVTIPKRFVDGIIIGKPCKFLYNRYGRIADIQYNDD